MLSLSREENKTERERESGALFRLGEGCLHWGSSRPGPQREETEALVCEVVDDVLRPGDLRGAGVDGHVAASRIFQARAAT